MAASSSPPRQEKRPRNPPRHQTLASRSLSISTADAPSGIYALANDSKEGRWWPCLGTWDRQDLAGPSHGRRVAGRPDSNGSPTFTLIRRIPGTAPSLFTPIYTGPTAAQLDDTGLNDYLDGHTITAIEWADRWNVGLPPDRLDIHLSHWPHRDTSRHSDCHWPFSLPVTGCCSDPPFEEPFH